MKFEGGINDSALGNRYIYGTALFIGWFSLVMGLIGMLLQIVGTTSNNEDMDDDYRPYGGNPGYNQSGFEKDKVQKSHRVELVFLKYIIFDYLVYYILYNFFWSKLFIRSLAISKPRTTTT